MNYNVSHSGLNSYGNEYSILSAELKRLQLVEYNKERKNVNGDIINAARIAEIEERMKKIKDDYYKNNPPKGGRRYKCRKTKKSKKCKRRKTNRRR